MKVDEADTLGAVLDIEGTSSESNFCLLTTHALRTAGVQYPQMGYLSGFRPVQMIPLRCAVHWTLRVIPS